jgi:hypothetical protein
MRALRPAGSGLQMAPGAGGISIGMATLSIGIY